jgi:NADH-quinone oxidoreductase subunit N
LPPLAGFLAKFYVFLAAVEAGLLVPAIIGVLASAVGLVYYLRLTKIMFFDEPAPAFDGRRSIAPRLIISLSGAFALLLILAPLPLVNAAAAAARALLP